MVSFSSVLRRFQTGPVGAELAGCSVWLCAETQDRSITRRGTSLAVFCRLCSWSGRPQACLVWGDAKVLAASSRRGKSGILILAEWNLTISMSIFFQISILRVVHNYYHCFVCFFSDGHLHNVWINGGSTIYKPAPFMSNIHELQVLFYVNVP